MSSSSVRNVTIPSAQQEVAAFLAKLAGHQPINTHISAVFIGEETVWKLKKAVKLSFLDFSTLAARERFLRRELVINQPSAPGIYRDVVPIGRGPDGGLHLGAEPAVEWVLRMARVPAADFLEHIAADGGLTPALLDALGDAVVRDQTLRPQVPGWDSAAALLRVTAGNAASALAAGLPSEAVAVWRRQTEAAINALRPWLTDRAAAGFVRRCHGDLHLGNLCLWEGTPVPFDALEFNEVMATIDTGYDLAFLLMDLEHQVGRDAATRVMNRVIARTGDVAMTRGLPVFLSLRAMIRAHVLTAMNEPARGRRYLELGPALFIPAAAGNAGDWRATGDRQVHARPRSCRQPGRRAGGRRATQ